jgi:hypothetical protein
VAFSIGGFSSGMEYPGAVFDGVNSRMPGFFGLTVHEFGHSWFPMLVGSNERRNAFMDEGFNTFIDIAVSDVFENGKFGPKRDGEYSAGGEPPDTILKVLDNPEAPPILTRADGYTGALTHPVSYFKGAYGNTLLRDQILGPERFDEAFRKYIRDWAFKHPSPSDFFRTMDSEGGEDLSYFWRGWYMNNWTLDLAVQGATYVGGDPKNGLTVTVANKRPLVLPATLEVTMCCRMMTARIIRSKFLETMRVRPGISPVRLDLRVIYALDCLSQISFESENCHESPFPQASCRTALSSDRHLIRNRAGHGWRQSRSGCPGADQIPGL